MENSICGTTDVELLADLLGLLNVLCRFDVGNGQQILQTKLKVDDGRWHVAHIKRYRKTLPLQK